MVLILTEPAPSGVKVYPNEVKVFRLHEWLGPARGSLTTVSDPLSLCGTVVKDTQTVAYTGTQPNQTILTNMNTSGGAFDTIRIPLSDLDIGTTFNYWVYISARCEGSIDPTKRKSGHEFMIVGNNAAAVGGGSRNSLFTTYSNFGITAFAPKPQTNPYYRVLLVVGGIGIQDNFFNNPTTDNFVLRACTGTGGTFTWYLDCMYLVPRGSRESGGGLYSDSDFRKILPNVDFDPIYDRATFTWDHTKDDVTLDITEGQYSAMSSAPSGFDASSSRPAADFQEGENEKTLWDVSGDGFWTVFPDDKPSDLTIIAGSIYVPSQVVDSDSFTRTIVPDNVNFIGESSEGRIYTVLRDHPYQAASFPSGFGTTGTELIFQNGHYDQLFPQTPGDTADPGLIYFGGSHTESGTGSTTKGHESLNGMDFSTIDIKVKTNDILVAGFHMFFGYSDSNSRSCGVILIIPPGDFFNPSEVLNAALVYLPTMAGNRAGVNQSDIYLDGPINITNSYAADTYVRIKVERLLYKYRAKVWLDGTTEPSSWQLEGFIPIDYGTPSTRFLYPYTLDTNFHGRDRRNSYGLFPAMGVRYFPPYENINGGPVPFSGLPIKETHTYWDDFVVTYNDYGSTLSDIHLRLKKYDDSVDFGDVIIPYQSQRVVISPLRNHTFNNDTNGYSVTLWKEPGTSKTQAAIISDVWEKIRRGKDIGVYELVPLK